jgi:hypothetical protein
MKSKVEKAIFKVHRSILARYSTVIKDMLEVPPSSEFPDGTDEHPLVLDGDGVSGWELLLGTQYNRSFSSPSPPRIILTRPRIRPRFYTEPFTGDHLTAILPIAHKYCMEAIEEDIVKQLKSGTTTAAYVDLMVAAQITGSEQLHQQALRALISSTPRLDLAQARRVGVDALHAITAATMLDYDAKLVKAEAGRITQCRHCPGANWRCDDCGRYQPH